MTGRPIVIGLVGHPGSGKDSCADALEPHGFVRLAFADALRIEIATAWRVDVRVLTDRALKETPRAVLAISMCMDGKFVAWAVRNGHDLYEPRSARWLLQRWGTDYRRAQTSDYWVLQLEQVVRRRLGSGWRRLVVTDVRMANEAEMVRRVGGRLLRVHRPELSLMSHDTVAHSSEDHDGLAVDGDVHNDGTLDELRHEIGRVLRAVLRTPAAAATA